jgi:hypothetical protein
MKLSQTFLHTCENGFLNQDIFNLTSSKLTNFVQRNNSVQNFCQELPECQILGLRESKAYYL